MTISYSGNFFRLLLRWKGSIWRSVWKELIVYIMLYFAIRLFYIHGIDLLDDDESDRRFYRSKFEALCRKFDSYTKLIPLTFLLGFYVSNVVSRWWRQFETIYWPEDIVSVMCTVIHANDEDSQKRRHTITRYINLSAALAWRDISSKIRLRFPTVHSLVDSGLLTEKEYDLLESKTEDCQSVRWLTPLHWVQQLLRKEEETTNTTTHEEPDSQITVPLTSHKRSGERTEKKPTASLLNNFVTELKLYRQSLRKLYSYDWVCVPLVYTQVAALATYAFFFFAVFGRQALLPDINSGKEIDTVLPIFLIVQFMFFVGWFKIGQDLMRPFGLDDDDIELNYILDRNISTSFSIINQIHTSEPPEFEEDFFWKNRQGRIDPLPHTPRSRRLAEHRPKLHSYVRIGDGEDVDSKSCLTRVRDKRYIDW